ncbi:MAG: Xaa-Pro dipeptidase [Chlamydiae bacterium]|nr:Xaa-Pro dipeptidase [Chlamydiota bacterium]
MNREKIVIKFIQEQLKFHKIEGWLLYDLHGANSLAVDVLQIPEGIMMTRRCFYWIPQEGLPIKIVHRIEAHNLDHLPGEKRLYLSWREMHKQLHELLRGVNQVAMEYSPNHAIPTLSKVDGGLIDLIRSTGTQVVSSAPFLQPLTCVWTDEQYSLHKEAASILEKSVGKAWTLIADSLNSGKSITEYAIQQFILSEFEKRGCVTEGLPICAINENAADPHYSPTKERAENVKKGDLILIDLWCKRDLPQAVFADITRVGVAASQPTARQQEIFSIVHRAQKTGTDLIRERYQKGQEIKGAEVDHAVRRVIEDAGYGSYFTHRTGHNIHRDVHGPGANLDGLETEDNRPLIPGTCFSIEPGIYLPGELGVRLEYDVYIHADGEIEVTLPPQDTLVTLG